jgi:hypothetical protein
MKTTTTPNGVPTKPWPHGCHKPIQWNGETLSKRDIIRRFIALYPKDNATQIGVRIKTEVGCKISETEVARLRRMEGSSLRKTIFWDGEHLTRREVLRRYMTQNPAMECRDLLAKIEQERGVKIMDREFYHIRQLVRGTPHPSKAPKPHPSKAPKTLLDGVVEAHLTITSHDSNRLITVIKCLREAQAILGSKDAIKTVLDLL